MNNQTLDSKVCRNLQLPLAIMVVFLHSFGLPSDVDIAGIDYTSLTGLDFYNLIRVICSRLLSNCAVPAFLSFLVIISSMTLTLWEITINHISSVNGESGFIRYLFHI